MRNFSGNKRTDRRKDFGKKGPRDSERPAMHRATCDHCGKDCEVPFKPTSGKPIYCSSCFDKSPNKDTKKYGGERGDRRFNSSEPRKRSFDGESERGNDQLKREIGLLNKKLDKILDILSDGFYEEPYDDDLEDEMDMPKPEKKPGKKAASKKSK